jgi:hypothetical protein
MMRVLVDSAVTPEIFINDPSSSLYANLHGVYDAGVFPSVGPRRLNAFCSATIIAHEQRHYTDYLLTNYGSWLSRFWPQIKQLVPSLLNHDGPIPIPVRYWTDPLWSENLNIALPDSGHARNAAVLARNHSDVLSIDRVQGQKKFGWFSGHAQLEAMATAFEVGPVEMLLEPQGWLEVARALPRDLASWRQAYVWPAQIFADFEIGRAPLYLDEPGHIIDTRLWPTVLIASLMGKFTDLTVAKLAVNSKIYDNVLPSRRFLQIMLWLRKKRHGAISTPETAWEAVNEACMNLFGATIIESMSQELEACEAKVSQQLPGPLGEKVMDYTTLETLTHFRERRRLLALFESDPLKFTDPVEYWETGIVHEAALVPEYFIVNREGFPRIPPGHGLFKTYMYQGTKGGKPIFVKPHAAFQDQDEMQAEDELLTTFARFFISGCLSDAWVGPELTSVRGGIEENMSVRLIPPYNRFHGHWSD